MFVRRKRQQQLMREIEDEAVRQVLDMTHTMTFPGSVITPEGVAQAANMVAMQVTTSAIEAGASPEHSAELMAAYARVGQKLGSLFGPGGPYEGATAPE